MTIELTEGQREALARAVETPPIVVDPASQTTYVLLRTEAYQQMTARLEEEEEIPAVRAMYPHILDVMKGDWEGPAMDVYDEGPPHDAAR
jgi:hypothetical protein